MTTTQTVDLHDLPTFDDMATLPADEFIRRMDEALVAYNFQPDQLVNAMLAAALREPITRFAGQVEMVRNTAVHRQRTWEKWRRRQARKQNRRRN